MKILLADDEVSTQKLISGLLEDEGHECVCVEDGTDALEAFENASFDLVILDVMMPGMDGFEVLREIREQENGEKHLPVMLLTARAEDADQVRGLEGGADDYVTKPFSPIVLAARVRTLLKREGRAASPLEIIGLLSVNELRREVLVEDQPVDLTPKEYELLFYLVRNKGIALTREKLLYDVWGFDFYGDDRTVDTHIKMLRGNLKEYRKFIVTLRGLGYKFEV